MMDTAYTKRSVMGGCLCLLTNLRGTAARPAYPIIASVWSGSEKAVGNLLFEHNPDSVYGSGLSLVGRAYFMTEGAAREWMYALIGGETK